jgi:hypothetical protein
VSIQNPKELFAGRKSISPVYKLEFVPPRVKIPPDTSELTSFGSWSWRVNQNENSGEGSLFCWMRASQNGTVFVAVREGKARPMMPAPVPLMRPELIFVAKTDRIEAKK